MKTFEGKVALVTGATRGIGRAIAVRLAKEGALVAVNYRASGNPEETLRLIKETGGDGFPVEADMRNPEQVIAMVDETAKKGGSLDYLVSNAAINPLLTWDETTLEHYDNIQETNLRGTWVVCQAAAKQMIKEGHGGAIVTIASISSWVSARTQVVYCGIKAGIWMLTKSLASVLGEHGIRVNTILPGAIATDMAEPLLKDAPVLKYYKERIPLHRIGKPEEIAGAAAFLLSDDAGYCTSSELLVDGGFITNAEYM
jgi:NAD(P)-dependent dehydrogenase (short-subunit alcohol dehydrogenase family)